MKPNKKITNETLAANREKMLRSHSYQKRVKGNTELVRRYLLMDKTPRSKNDTNGGFVMGDEDIKQFAHFFAEEMRVNNSNPIYSSDI